MIRSFLLRAILARLVASALLLAVAGDNARTSAETGATAFGAAATGTNCLLTMVSNRDYVGAGRNYLIHDGQWSGYASSELATGQVDTVRIDVFDETGENWSLYFSSRMTGQPLRIGRYTLAERWPFEDAGRPGLSVSGDGRGCNGLEGEFTIRDIAVSTGGSGPRLVRFVAEFVQYCEYRKPSLRGTVYFDATLPAFPTLVSPNVVAVEHGASVDTVVEPHALAGDAVPLRLSAAMTPAEPTIAVSFDSSEVAAGSQARMLVTTAPDTPRGDYVVTVTATDGTSSSTATQLLTVRGTTQLSVSSGPGYGVVASPAQFYPHRDDYDWVEYAVSNRPDGQIDEVDVNCITPGGVGVWKMTFSTVGLGVPLTPGYYGDAVSAFTVTPGHPAIVVEQSGITLLGATLSGSFRVVDAEYDTSGLYPRLVSFGAEFEQTITSAPAGVTFPTVRGSVYVNSLAPSFRLAGPSATVVAQRDTSVIRVPLVRQNGFADPVTVTAEVVPPFESTDFRLDASAIDATGEVVVTIAPSKREPPGRHVVVLRGTSGERESDTNFLVDVMRPGFVATPSPAGQIDLARGTSTNVTVGLVRTGGVTDAISAAVARSNVLRRLGIAVSPKRARTSGSELSFTVSASASATTGPVYVTITFVDEHARTQIVHVMLNVT